MNTSSEFAPTEGDIFSSNVQKKSWKPNLPITDHVENNLFSWQGCAANIFFRCLYWQTLGSHFLSISRKFPEDFLIISIGWAGGGFQGGDSRQCPLGCLGFSAARFHDTQLHLCFSLVRAPQPLTDAVSATRPQRLNTLPFLQRTTLQTIFRS